MSTEKIIPSRAASHSVVGGKTQKTIHHSQSVGRLVLDGTRVNAAATNIAAGPQTYIPARTQPHRGVPLSRVQNTMPRSTSPSRAPKLRATIPTFCLKTADSKMTGSQNASPPTTIQNKLFLGILMIDSIHPAGVEHASQVSSCSRNDAIDVEQCRTAGRCNQGHNYRHGQVPCPRVIQCLQTSPHALGPTVVGEMTAQPVQCVPRVCACLKVD